MRGTATSPHTTSGHSFLHYSDYSGVLVVKLTVSHLAMTCSAFFFNLKFRSRVQNSAQLNWIFRYNNYFCNTRVQNSVQLNWIFRYCTIIIFLIYKQTANIQIKYAYSYQHTATCFGDYCATFRKNFIVWSKLPLNYQSFLHQLMHRFFKMSIKIYIKQLQHISV
jgi:hypothetical protein